MRAMTKSSSVSDIVERMGDQSDFHVALARAPIFMKRLKVAHKEHEAMIAAIEKGNAREAVEIMRAHVLAIAARIEKLNKQQS